MAIEAFVEAQRAARLKPAIVDAEIAEDGVWPRRTHATISGDSGA
jgi:hypothetical protein